MPVRPTYPGVYIEELPSSVRTITGVSTSVTAFIGRTRRGPVNKAVTVHSFPEYERTFGGLWEESSMGYSVFQYFQNGGRDAIIVRVFSENADENFATLSLPDAGGVEAVPLIAISPGSWGDSLRARVDYETIDDPTGILFNLRINDLKTGLIETHRNLSSVPGDVRFVTNVLAEDSNLVRVDGPDGSISRPDFSVPPTGDATDFEDNSGDSNAVEAVPATDGDALSNGDILGSGTGSVGDPKIGLFAFDEADTINILCVPPYVPDSNGNVLNGDVSSLVRDDALAYAKIRRAIYLVDSPSDWVSKSDVDLDAFGLNPDKDAAIYFPRIKSPDVLQEGRMGTFTPSGAIAGLMARTDAQRGVWKAPAGIEATLFGVPDLSVILTDAENGELNPQGINCLRAFKGIGRVAWGARTMRGADLLADQWKYLPVRRLALYLEESLYRGSKWIVFEPNDEPLWAQIRLNFGAFMHNLFRQGAFQGTTPKDAYLVKCDSETTTQNDINSGIVNIVVGFAPLKPAEFVIIKIQQLAGQVEA